VAETLRLVEECTPPPLPALPRDLAAVCFKCLEREPAARYASASALAADLRAWLDGRPVIARPVSPAGRLLRWARRKPALAGLTLALGVALGALGVNIVVSRNATLAAEQRRAEIAESFAREQKRTALLAHAQLRLRTPDAGRRSESLRLLSEAWRIGPSVEIRSAAIAALALPDAEEMALPRGVTFAEPPAAPELGLPLPTAVVACAFHPGSGRLALAAQDKLVYLVDLPQRAIIQRLRGLGGTCRALSFSPDGHWLATVARDGTLRLWSVRDGEELLIIDRDVYEKDTALRWSDDGQWLTLRSGRAFRITTPEVARFFIPESVAQRAEEICTIDVSADGRWLVTVDEAGTRLWDARTRRNVALFAKTGAEWSAARFSPDSRRLWLGGWNSALRVVDLPATDNTAPTDAARVADFAGSLIEQSDDGAWLTALSNDGGGFQFVTSTAPRRVVWLRHRHPMGLALTHDARRAATSSYDSAGVRIWDFPSAKLLRELPIEPPAQLAFTPDGATLATGRQHTATLWNTATGERGPTLPAVARIHSLAFSPDSRLLAIETHDGIVLFRATEPFDELAHLATVPDHGAASFCFSRDSRQLAVQTTAGGAVVWQLDALHRELSALGMAWDRPLRVTKDK
jgi:WD40 repeat protein